MHYLWTNILQEWRDANHFGLTVPFLFGGILQHPEAPLGDGSSLEEKFQRMLLLFAEYGAGHNNLRLSFCSTVEDLTFAAARDIPQGCVGIDYPPLTTPRLWVQSDLVPEDDSSLEVLTQELWLRYKQPILDGNFSRHNLTYRTFDESDLQLLARAYSKEPA